MRLDCGRVGVEREERDLRGDVVERVGRGRRIDDRHHDRADAGGHEVVHHAALDGGVGALGIFEVQLEVRQLVLGLGDGRFGMIFQKSDGAVHDEGDLGLSCAWANPIDATETASASPNR